MERIVLMCFVSSMALMNIANAEVPSTADLKAYQAFTTKHGDDLLAKKSDARCFAEHICAAEGTIGLDLGCDYELPKCLNLRAKLGVSIESSPYFKENCMPLFNTMTPAQNAIVASPKGCEVPPPVSAFQASLTPGEANCLANIDCTEGLNLLGNEKMCRQNYDACSKPLRAMDSLERSTCRGLRWIGSTGEAPRLSSNGPCRPEMADPVLATVPGTTNRSETVRSKPLTPKEQSSEAASSKTDEFDLGDLDF